MNAKVIAATIAKGGTIKTTMTVNMAGVLAKRGKKVLLVDLDSQGDISITFGKNPDKYETTIYDVLVGGEARDKAIYPVDENIYILPSNDDMAFFELDVLTQPEKFQNYFLLLKRTIDDMRSEFDYILIDTPPNLGLIAGNVYMAADEVILPYHPEKYSLRSLLKTIKNLKNWQEKNTGMKIKAVVPVKVKNTTKHGQYLDLADSLLSDNKVDMTATQIPETVKYSDFMSDFSKPLTLLSETDFVGRKRDYDLLSAYNAIYQELVNELGY